METRQHRLTGTVWVKDAADAQRQVEEAASRYFGGHDFTVSFSTRERRLQRNNGDSVLAGYEADYTAEAV